MQPFPPRTGPTLSIRILTLGRIAVLRDGVELDALLRQPLRLALLVYIAVEREASRDALQQMFWPRRSARRARHSLNQALYQLRSVIGDDAIVTRGEFVRIGASVTTDCARLDADMVATRTLSDTGLRGYAGPFLDDFPDPTPAFSRWAAQRRARYAEINRVARRQQLDALLEAGHRAAALDAARQWARTEAADGEAASRLAELIEESRALRARAPAAHGMRRVPPPAPSRMPLIQALVVIGLAALGLAIAAAPPNSRDGGLPDLAVGVVAFHGDPSETAEGAVHQSFLRALGWLPGAAGVEVKGVRAPAPGWAEDRGAEVVGRAERLGLAYVVTGRLTARGDGPAITVEVWDARSGARVLRASAPRDEPPEDAVSRLAFEMTRALADREDRDFGLPAAVLDDTRDPAALGHFLRGRRLMSAGRPGEARAAFGDAIRLDPAFGYAHVRAAAADAWASDVSPDAVRRTVDTALSSGVPLSDTAVRLLHGFRLHATGDALGAVEAFRSVIAIEPQNADARAGLALTLHQGGEASSTLMRQAASAYRGLLHVDSLYAPVRQRIFDIALLLGDAAGAGAALSRLPPGPERAVQSLVFDMLHGGAEARGAALDSIRWFDRDALSAAFRMLATARSGLPLADSIGALLQETIRIPSDRAHGGGLRLAALAAMDRWDEGLAAWRRTALQEPLDPIIVAAHLAGWPAAEHASAVYSRARALSGAGSEGAEGARLILAYRASIIGTTTDVSAARARLDDGRDSAAPAAKVLREALDARLLLIAGDTAAAIRTLEAALPTAPRSDAPGHPLDCFGLQKLLLLRLHLARGDSASAVRPARSLHRSPCPADLLTRPFAVPLLR